MKASSSHTLIATKRTAGSWNALFDIVVKSVSRVPTASTRSASRAHWLAASVPVTPRAPSVSGWSHAIALFPACVSATAMPAASANRRSASLASL